MLRSLVIEIESLTQRAYAHIPPGVQWKLARDQFIWDILLVELHAQVQLLHPDTLCAMLKMAEECGGAPEMKPQA